jgi:hypothetical protein
MAPAQSVPPTVGDLLKAFNTKATAILKSIVTTEIDAPGSTVYFTNSALHQLKSLNN